VLFIHITRLASNELFSPSNKIHREVGRAKDLSASQYSFLSHGARLFTWEVHGKWNITWAVLFYLFLFLEFSLFIIVRTLHKLVYYHTLSCKIALTSQYIIMSSVLDRSQNQQFTLISINITWCIISCLRDSST